MPNKTSEIVLGRIVFVPEGMEVVDSDAKGLFTYCAVKLESMGVTMDEIVKEYALIEKEKTNV